jgi:hypothetical protein
MNLLSRTLLGASLLLSAARALAQHDAPAWTEARAISRAVTHAPEVRRAVALLEESRARRAYAEVPAVGNPTVAVRAMVGVPDVPAATYGRWSSGCPSTWPARARADADEVVLGRARGPRARRRRRRTTPGTARGVAWVDASASPRRPCASPRRSPAGPPRRCSQRVRARADGAGPPPPLDVAPRRARVGRPPLDRARRRSAGPRGPPRARLRDALDLGPDRGRRRRPRRAPRAPRGGTRRRPSTPLGGRNLAEPRAFAFAVLAPARLGVATLLRRGRRPRLLAQRRSSSGRGYNAVLGGRVGAVGAPRGAHRARRARRVPRGPRAPRTLEGELAARARRARGRRGLHALRHASEELASLDADAVIPAAERALSRSPSRSAGSGAVEFFRVLSRRDRSSPPPAVRRLRRAARGVARAARPRPRHSITDRDTPGAQRHEHTLDLDLPP